MKYSVTILLFFLVVFFSSCGIMATSKFRKISKWDGKDQEDIYLVYGTPTIQETLANEQKSIIYHFVPTGPDSLEISELQFILKDDIVSKVYYNGSRKGIKKYIKSPKS